MLLKPFKLLFVSGLAAAASNAAEIVETPISALHPTQAYIAHDQVNYNLQRYQTDRQKFFDDLCETWGQGNEAIVRDDSRAHDRRSFDCLLSDEPGARPQDMKTAVRGPEGQLYLTDGHHTFSILGDMASLGTHFVVPVVVTHDRSDLDEADFWRWLRENNLAWLQRIGDYMLTMPVDTPIGPNGETPDTMGRRPVHEADPLAPLLCDASGQGRLALALAIRNIPVNCQ